MSTTASIVPSGTRTTSLVASLFSTTLATTSSAITSVTTALSTPAAETTTYLGDASLNSHDSSNSPSVSNLREPFYATTVPMCYALAATTVTSYMLLIMLFITPRSFLDGGVVYLGRRSGFTHSSSGGDNIGGRPWLQKVAALTVAVSLTIATCDTFHFLAEQYKFGAQNATVLQTEVMGSMELRVIRLVSNFFLWLAQAQTLIRLFPRHREKVIIKWVAFALITLDLIFSAINSFRRGGANQNYNPMGGGFTHPIPALSYMFQLLLGVLYAAWVIYYALMKKRYAFYHPLMKNMCLLAIISLAAILIPIVFFILDISNPTFARWGDYVRWVGAAAASVIVWEWVERIEALEREEKRGGVLGREVFEGEEMLEVSALDYPWDRKRKHRKDGSFGGLGGSGRGDDESRGANGNANVGGFGGRNSHGHMQSNGRPSVSAITGRQRGQRRTAAPGQTPEQNAQRTIGDIFRPHWPARPAAVMTPVSRTDTPSAASTVYAVRYQPPSETTGRTPDLFARTPELHVSHSEQQPHTSTNANSQSPPQSSPQQQSQLSTPELSRQDSPQKSSQIRVESSSPRRQKAHGGRSSTNSTVDLEANSPLPSRTDRWRALSQAPSRRSPTRQRQAPRQEVSRHDTMGSRWDIKSRLEMFAANQADKIREKLRPTTDTDSLPVTFIPAPPRQGAALEQVLEEEGLSRRSTSSDSDDEGRRDQGQARHMGEGQNGNLRGASSTDSVSPPLWPGIRRRLVTYENDDEYSYTDESLESSSDENVGEDDSAEDSGPSRGGGANESGRRE
ncbi:pH signaling pathway protein [Metarhizium album ARSEF 1941]|uniref:pH signaling pathway protein n=1 Tax=Metarhizium album (strain ARSEF 1941) TaxID=1081103 RepID=A0A0B2WWY0_METAS|nr:pH signaling pathway protein [Metarhizium album ARSEF 1941]KHO00722.1 pH signaling pathway protein [Metarhizium album ARSEF 1941]